MAAKDKDAGTLGNKPLGLDEESIKRSLASRLHYFIGKDLNTVTARDWYHVAAYVIRDRLVDRWMETMRTYYRVETKRVYYFSLEFLMGRTLINSLLNMGILDVFKHAIESIGVTLEQIDDMEPEAALGNGGLGRLAACFLDSMATLGIPGYGYGIRYEYGMFYQYIENGYQVEHPDNWLRYGNPWEFPRPEVLYPIKFYGHTVQYPDESGKVRHHWVDTDDIMAMAYDTPIPGYGTHTVNNMRLWAAKSSRDFELRDFNRGNYIKAVEHKSGSETISKVLYPDDTTYMGKELRLKQEYLFVSASLQDIIFRYKKHHEFFDELPDQIAIQLNDTHPSIAIPEMMRLLVDVHRTPWDEAWSVTTRTFSYTNHTLMPEALETWPVATFSKLLPRHLEIIFEINQRFLTEVGHRHPGDTDLLRRLSIIDEEGGRRVRMAYLAIIGSHRVNGVAELHTHLMKKTIFADFYRLQPEKFVNKTNGVTPRRWLNQANPQLSTLIRRHIGDAWLKNLDELNKLVPLANDARFREEFRAVKRANKERLAALIKSQLGISVDSSSIFDIHVKRIHEYKRQLLNLLHVITLYNRIRANSGGDTTPRTVIFAGKAAPGYTMAKLIIKLINDVAGVVNHDPAVSDILKVAFIPNYNVSLAEDIIPACDLSQQISMAGMEASGTSNMKFALNGALTIGTLDGANIEIREEVGHENIFIFGHTTDGIAQLRAGGYDPRTYYDRDNALRLAIDMIGSGFFNREQPRLYEPVVNALLHHGDAYMLLADYESYINCHNDVAALYGNQEEWTRKAIINVAHMGKFSSDRTIREYAEDIWHVSPVKVHLPDATAVPER